MLVAHMELLFGENLYYNRILPSSLGLHTSTSNEIITIIAHSGNISATTTTTKIYKEPYIQPQINGHFSFLLSFSCIE